MSHGGEAAHIETDLGDDHFGAERTHAGDAADELDSDAKGSEVRLDLPINRRDRCIETINLPEMELQQKAMMAGHAPTQCLLQPGLRGLHGPMRKRSQPAPIGLAGAHGLEHWPSALAEHIGEFRSK